MQEATQKAQEQGSNITGNIADNATNGVGDQVGEKVADTAGKVADGAADGAKKTGFFKKIGNGVKNTVNNVKNSKVGQFTTSAVKVGSTIYKENKTEINAAMKGISALAGAGKSKAAQGTQNTTTAQNTNSTGNKRQINYRSQAYSAMSRTDKMMNRTSYKGNGSSTLQNVQNELLRKKKMS